ncbi:MAG TPA: esterase-like activity of phytase family protein, partial [Rhodocyclaceae bacterium]|nr:esterase-like activity of phytase family protein [Rhodocyclaceae bacterium]
MKNLVTGLMVVWTSLTCPAHAADLEYIGQQIIPNGTVFNSTNIGGLSAIDYDPASKRYFALSDDRSEHNAMRFYTFSLDLEKFKRDSQPGMAGVHFENVTSILQANGNVYPKGGADPEGLRYDAKRHALYWSNEGKRGWTRFQNPSVRGMDESGKYLRDFAVPAYYNPAGSSGGSRSKDMGVYDNRGFESLAISADGKTLWTATEEGLAQ